MTLGLISDTHGYLDPRVAKIFAGVNHILHAGDIGPDAIIAELEAIAPVTAVLGNNDSSPAFPLTQVRSLGGIKFLLHHIVTPRELHSELKLRIAGETVQAVVFGHSHQPFDEEVGGIRFINPGYAGKPRFNQPRTVALLELAAGRMNARFIKL